MVSCRPVSLYSRFSAPKTKRYTDNITGISRKDRKTVEIMLLYHVGMGLKTSHFYTWRLQLLADEKLDSAYRFAYDICEKGASMTRVGTAAGKAAGNLRRAPLLLFLVIAHFLPALTIKMGSLIPPGSPWDINLRRMAVEWAEFFNDTATTEIYTGGAAGDEQDILRKIRLKQLHAAGLTTGGLTQIFAGVLAPGIPLLVETEDELDYVLREMTPMFSEEFSKQGYKILFWTTAGWAHFFSRDPVVYPADLREQKIWNMAGNPRVANAFRKMGFRIVTFPMMDMLIQLQTGGADAFVTSPLVVATNQWFGVAKHMTAWRYAPFFGAFVILAETWNKIPADLRPKLQAVADKYARRMREETIRASREAVEAMEKIGLTVNEAPEEALRAWRDLVEEGLEFFVGRQFDVAFYDRARKLIEDFRRSGGSRQGGDSTDRGG
jgi:TRAP-type C4-dicarboxylate transport system substrate-binding protein